MTIIQKQLKEKMTIDLDGPEGNAFCLLGNASKLATRLGYDGDEILSEMKSGDYANLVQTFESYFGSFVILETTNKELL